MPRIDVDVIPQIPGVWTVYYGRESGVDVRRTDDGKGFRCDICHRNRPAGEKVRPCRHIRMLRVALSYGDRYSMEGAAIW